MLSDDKFLRDAVIIGATAVATPPRPFCAVCEKVYLGWRLELNLSVFIFFCLHLQGLNMADMLSYQFLSEHCVLF